MNIDVISLLKERCRYPIATTETIDGFIDEAIKTNPERCCFICPELVFTKYCHKHNILDKYHITAVFDLSTVFMPYISVRMSLFVLSKNESKVVKIGHYAGNVTTNIPKVKDARSTPQIKLPDNMCAEFLDYCQLINAWLNKGGLTPIDTDYYEFNAVERKSFDNNKPFAHRHTKQVFKVIEQLKVEKTKRLDEVADIIAPKREEKENGFTLTSKCLKYPFDDKQLTYGAKTDSLILKGDIVFQSSSNMFYLITEELEQVYINSLMYIIRPKEGISPEYLFVYLNSETSKIITSSLSVGSVVKRMSVKDLSAIPVISQPKNVAEYKSIFKELYVSDDDSISEITKLITGLNSNRDTLEGSLLTEQVQKLKLIKDPKVRNLILEDVKELKTCFESGAYKAALILSGSILEAFMIDWLGSINGKDYFSEDYMVPDRWDKMKTKRAELIDYIDAVAEIKKPDWMEEQSKAHHIRYKRNMVHAKLCMKKSQQINEETCKQVIDYLIEIISTRYKNIF